MLIHNKTAIISHDSSNTRHDEEIITKKTLEFSREYAESLEGMQFWFNRYYLATLYRLTLYGLGGFGLYGRDQYPGEDRLKLEEMPKGLTK